MIHRERYLPYQLGTSVGKLESTYVDTISGSVRKDTSINDSSAFMKTYCGGYQITDTESHPEWVHRPKGKAFTRDLGGPFYSFRGYMYQKPGFNGLRAYRDTPEFVVTSKYEGPCLPVSPHLINYPQMPVKSDDQTLDELGTTAIARCSPSNPSVDLAVTIGEFFREGIPAIVGGTLRQWRGLSDRDRRRAIGNEYLNVEFGWKPLIRDLTDFCKSVVNAHEIFESYERGSGKMVRRKYDFPEEKVQETWVAFDPASPWFSPSSSELFIPGFSNWGKVYITETRYVRRWFRGAFTYYVPPPDGGLRNGLARAVIQARKVLGISLTPDTLWNLAPWSWAVDWFSNTGDLLSNWTDWAIDNQVLLYGYIMEHKLHERTYTFAGNTGLQTPAPPGDVVSILETKVRRHSTPYGFGLQWDDLSARQQAILAALGVSRSR